MKKTTTISALWKYLKKDYLTPKEENKITDFIINFKLIIFTLLATIILLWFLNLFGCFEGILGKNE